MKKVFAIVLALALMMVGSVALAADNGGKFGNGDTAVVPVTYTATDPVNVTISWGNLDAFAYSWNNGKWTTSGNKEVTFTVKNNGFASQNVTLAADVTAVNKFVNSATFATTGAMTVANTAVDGVTNVLTVAPVVEVSSTDITSATTSATDAGNITVTATIATTPAA